jgi:chromosome segregation ATPase
MPSAFPRPTSPGPSENEPNDDEYVVLPYSRLRAREDRAEAAEYNLQALQDDYEDLERDYNDNAENIQKGKEFDSVAVAYMDTAADLETSKMMLKGNMTALRIDKMAFKAKMMTLKGKVAALKVDKMSLKTKVTALEGENATLRQQITSQSETADAEAQQLRDEINALKASLSDQASGTKRSSDDVLDHHGALALRSIKPRRGKHAPEVSQPDCYHRECH